MIRVAQRGLSELEIILALLRLQQDWECDSSNYLAKKKGGLAASHSTQLSLETVQRTCRSSRSTRSHVRSSAYRRKTVTGGAESLSKRFNRFRSEHWRILHASLERVTKKTMGLYVLPDRQWYR